MQTCDFWISDVAVIMLTATCTKKIKVPSQQWHIYKYFGGGSYINAYFPRVNHFDSSSKLHFGINVSMSKLIHQAPMEAVLFTSGLMGVKCTNFDNVSLERNGRKFIKLGIGKC